jgi:L,D-transpeptidase YcbB
MLPGAARGLHVTISHSVRAAGRLFLLAVIAAILPGLGSAFPGPRPQSAPTSSTQIETFIAAGALDDLRWPNFSDCRDDVKNIYAPTNDAFAWLKDGKPTPQALAVISALEQADQEGLNPDDYDGPRWNDRVAKLSGQNPPPEEQLARFDLALTVSLVRYVTEERFGRVKPQAVNLKANEARREFDVAQFIREQVMNSNDVAAALLQLEPPYILYRRTEEAMRHYMQLAAQDDGEKLPPPAPKKKSIDPGDDYPGVPRLTRLLKLVGDLPADAEVAPDSTLYVGVLVDAMKRYQERHGLEPDGRIGKDTLDQLNTRLADRAQQLQLTLERWRWVPRVIEPPPILVNIPEFVLRGFGPEESIEITMRVIVGKSYRTHTPVFAQDMSYIVFRPYWNVPIAIQRAEIVPKLKNDPDYLVKNQMEVVDSHGTVVTDGAVSAEQLAKLNTGALNVRQKPGPKNSLGLAKFVFPNEHNVYLHSTPSQELFSRTRRDFSHGCIRVEFPDKLAEWILKGNQDWTLDKIQDAMKNGKDSQQVNLKQKRPVFIVYATAVVLPDGTVKFFQDIYGHDASLKKALTQGYPRPHRFGTTTDEPAPGTHAQS